MNQLEEIQIKLNKISDKIDQIKFITPQKIKSILTPQEIDILNIYFYNFQDAISALEAKVITLHDKIVVRDEKGQRIETTVGRIIFNEAVRKALA